MNGNEIFDIAMQAMPLKDMDAATQGHVYGVLSLALMLQEEAHNEQLRRADEELQDARRRWDAKAQQLHKERDMALAYRDEAYKERDAATKELRKWQSGEFTVKTDAELHGKP